MYQRVGTEFGKYQVRRVLGVGGMATVYYALASDAQQPIALKILAEQYADIPSFRQRFEFEAQITALLAHPNIVPVLDYGEVGSQLFIAMPYMSGGSLHDRFVLEGAISLQETARILRQLANALDYAHAQGVIHRDLKLANVLMDDDRNAKLSDFGIARLAESNLHLTDNGSVLGSPHYMSPEQNEGGPLDARSDLYALAVMVYLMITGQFPFHGDTALSIALQHLHKQPPPPTSIASTLPHEMDTVLLKGLAKLPDHRFDTATDFYNAFVRALGAYDSRTAIRVAQLSSLEAPPTADEYPVPANASHENGNGYGQLVTPAMGFAPQSPAESAIVAPVISNPPRIPPASPDVRVTAQHPALNGRGSDSRKRQGRLPMVLGAFGALILIAFVLIMSFSRLPGNNILSGNQSSRTATGTPPPTNTPQSGAGHPITATSLATPHLILLTATSNIVIPKSPQFVAISKNLYNPVNVRGGPGMNYPVISQLHPADEGVILARVGVDTPWYLISINGSPNAIGWVLGSVIDVLPSDSNSLKIPTAVTVPAPPAPAPTIQARG